MANLQIITFDVCGTTCALRRTAVQELLPLPRLWRPPALPRPVAGFFNLGGSAVSVLRLDVLFGLEERTGAPQDDLYRHLILVKGAGGSGPQALLVDRVLDVIHMGSATISPVRQEGSLNGCVEAEIEYDGQFAHLLSLERILLAEEQQALAELARQAQERLNEWAVPA
jgi:purine-binding chemotaxis protein CheW